MLISGGKCLRVLPSTLSCYADMSFLVLTCAPSLQCGDMGHDNQKRFFLTSKDDTTKYDKSDSRSAVLLSKHLDQKRKL